MSPQWTSGDKIRETGPSPVELASVRALVLAVFFLAVAGTP